jgi:hypothetical protein
LNSCYAACDCGKKNSAWTYGGPAGGGVLGAMAHCLCPTSHAALIDQIFASISSVF